METASDDGPPSPVDPAFIGSHIWVPMVTAVAQSQISEVGTPFRAAAGPANDRFGRCGLRRALDELEAHLIAVEVDVGGYG